MGPGSTEPSALFTRYVHDPDDPWSLGHDRVRAVYEDRDGRLWVGTDGGGLDRFDRASGELLASAGSPGGSQIVFVSDRDGFYELYLMAGQGTDDIDRMRSNEA